MGAGQFYIYLYALCFVAVGGLVAIGAGLVFWGRRKEKRARERRRVGPEEEGTGS
jgi:hypothetical protein